MENGRIKVWLPTIRANSGTDVFTRRFAEALGRRGMVAHITWFTPYDELFPLCLMRAVPPADTDIVFANSWVGYAFKRSGLPLIVTVHHAIFEQGLDDHKSFWRQLYHRFVAKPREAWSLRAADVVTTVSAYVADQVREQYGIEHGEVIHHWVDTDKFHPVEHFDRERVPFRLLFVGKATRLKGADLLAPVMRELGPTFELHITATKEECRWLDLPSNTHCLGNLSEDDLNHAYQRCDALICPSRSEGFGYAALEAMACGKPVVASNITALPEVIKNEFTGVLCSVGDIDAFVRACRRLAENTSLCRKMGNAGRQHVLENFSEQGMLHAYMHLIDGLLAKEMG